MSVVCVSCFLRLLLACVCYKAFPVGSCLLFYEVSEGRFSEGGSAPRFGGKILAVNIFLSVAQFYFVQNANKSVNHFSWKLSATI